MMKLMLIFTLVFATVAFAAIDDTELGENHAVGGPEVDFGLKDTLVNNLCTCEADVLNGYSASTIGGAYDRWIAYDAQPSGSHWPIDQLNNQWLYYAGNSDLGDMYFEIYDTDLNSSPIHSIFVDADDIVESDTGFDAFGRDVFLNEHDFGAQMDDFTVPAGCFYWIAMQMDTPSDNSFHAVNGNIIDELVYWYGDDGIWLSSFDAFGQDAEGSYALISPPI